MDSIYSTAKPFLVCSKVSGLFPMYFVGPTSMGFLQTRWHDILITSCSWSFLVALIAIETIFDLAFEADTPILFKAFLVYCFGSNFDFGPVCGSNHQSKWNQKFLGAFDMEVKSIHLHSMTKIKIDFVSGKSAGNSVRIQAT